LDVGFELFGTFGANFCKRYQSAAGATLQLANDMGVTRVRTQGEGLAF